MIFNKKKSETQINKILDKVDALINMSKGGKNQDLDKKEQYRVISQIAMEISNYANIINLEINIIKKIENKLLLEKENVRNLVANITGKMEGLKLANNENPATTLTNHDLTMLELSNMKTLHEELINLTKELLDKEEKSK